MHLLSIYLASTMWHPKIQGLSYSGAPLAVCLLEETNSYSQITGWHLVLETKSRICPSKCLGSLSHYHIIYQI